MVKIWRCFDFKKQDFSKPIVCFKRISVLFFLLFIVLFTNPAFSESTTTTKIYYYFNLEDKSGGSVVDFVEPVDPEDKEYDPCLLPTFTQDPDTGYLYCNGKCCNSDQFCYDGFNPPQCCSDLCDTDGDGDYDICASSGQQCCTDPCGKQKLVSGSCPEYEEPKVTVDDSGLQWTDCCYWLVDDEGNYVECRGGYEGPVVITTCYECGCIETPDWWSC